MQRFCIRHSHRGSSRAWRLILGRHTLDGDTYQRVVDEHDGCETCWRDTALAAVEAAANMLPVPVMLPSGVVVGPSVDRCLSRIEELLDAEAADRRDVGI